MHFINYYSFTIGSQSGLFVCVSVFLLSFVCFYFYIRHDVIIIQVPARHYAAAGSLKVVVQPNLEPIAIGYCTQQWMAALSACLLHIRVCFNSLTVSSSDEVPKTITKLLHWWQ